MVFVVQTWTRRKGEVSCCQGDSGVAETEQASGGSKQTQEAQ